MPDTIDMLVHSAAQVCTVSSEDGGPKRGESLADAGLIPYGAVAIHGGRIIDVGPSDVMRPAYQAETEVDASGRAVVPGFVDPHTHLVYAGDRAAEFEMRIGGATYMEIMAAGGGINSTVRATRAASLDELIESGLSRLNQMLALGTTTAEVKTGYGLDLQSELKLLEAIAVLDTLHPIDLVPTFLGAHAVPPEFHGRAGEYIDLVVREMIPAVAMWYRGSHFAQQDTPFFIDVFCEDGVFDSAQSRRVLEAGLSHGMRVKAHVDEFKTLGGVSMALALDATSLDHLDVTPHEEIQALSGSDTVAVLLPAVNFNLGSAHFANARALVDAGAAVALATDLNPGSAPCPSMPLVMGIATRYQRLTPAEALAASTLNAAHAIGLGHVTGSIEPGKRADLLILSRPDYRHLSYELGSILIEAMIKSGEIV